MIRRALSPLLMMRPVEGWEMADVDNVGTVWQAEPAEQAIYGETEELQPS